MLNDTHEILKRKAGRQVAQISYITCAKCGGTFKIDNRNLTTSLSLDKLNKEITSIYINCQSCLEFYELAVVKN